MKNSSPHDSSSTRRVNPSAASFPSSHRDLEGDSPRVRISNARRYFLFCMFCVANLLDSYNLNALFTGLPALKVAFGLDEAEASWVMSAFALTYAAFMLIVSSVRLLASHCISLTSDTTSRRADVSVMCTIPVSRPSTLLPVHTTDHSPEPSFVVGVFFLGTLSLVAGFVKDKIGLIILRAVCGICTFPSSGC